MVNLDSISDLFPLINNQEWYSSAKFWEQICETLSIVLQHGPHMFQIEHSGDAAPCHTPCIPLALYRNLRFRTALSSRVT